MNLVTVLGTGGTQGLLSIIVVYAVVIGVFWFFAIRPQKKQQKGTVYLQQAVFLA